MQLASKKLLGQNFLLHFVAIRIVLAGRCFITSISISDRSSFG